MRDVTVSICIVLGLCTASLPASAQLKRPVLYAVGSEPQRVVAGDFNNDGVPDLATADYSSNDVSILLGKGGGRFHPARPFTTALGPSAIAVGDFKGDGNLDLAVVEYGFNASVLQIYLGKGDGTFVAGASYTNVAQPYDITVGDFNGDGHLDLAIANNATNTISVMLGAGDGTFGKPHSYRVPLPERVLAVDVNGDKHPDLAVLAYCGEHPKICRSGAVAILLNDGTGDFGKPQFFSVKGTGPDGIDAADLNGDGKMDLVAANNNFQQASTVSVLLGNGDGTFKPAVNYPVGAGPAGLAIADIDGDGNPDIAVANTAGDSVSVLYGKGNGRFRPARDIPFASGSLPIDVTAADLDSDGVPDLAVALDYANQAAILMNRR